MRKYLLFTIVAFVVVFSGNLFFNARNLMAQAGNGAGFAPPPHERADNVKAQRMMNAFIANSNKRDHKYTQFNRQELIDALQAMDGVDSVKFVIGATVDNTPGKPNDKPVIMLQLQQPDIEQPGGYSYLTYTYMVGSICPPPYGRQCVLEPQ